MPHCYISTCPPCFSKYCIKTFVKCVPGIPFFAGHCQMNPTSLIANRYIYQDLFAEDGYMRDGEFNILHLDRHGGFIGDTQIFVELGYKFSAFTESLYYIAFMGWFKMLPVCYIIKL